MPSRNETAKTGAQRQRDYRARREIAIRKLQELIDAIGDAAERGASSKLTNHLPEEPFAAVDELCRRLAMVKLVPFRSKETPADA